MDRGQPKNTLCMRRALRAPLLAALLLLVSATAAQAANTIVVNDTGDPSGTGDCLNPDGGECSLRQAVGAAESDPPGDTIQLASRTYSLTQGSEIDITTSLTIKGDGVDETTIDGSGNTGDNGPITRMFAVDGAGPVAITGVTLTGGDDGNDATFCGGCRTVDGNGGGALFNDSGNVTLTDVAFTNNPGGFVGGGVSNLGGSLAMTDVSFTGDQGAIGGALFEHSGSVTGDRVTFENDATSPTDIGAVYLLGGTASFTNTTIVGSGGASSIAGGIHNTGATLALTNVTLSDNVEGDLETDLSASTTAENTIIANGFSEGEGDCIAPGRPDGAINQTSGPAITHDLGHNVDQDGSCGLNATGDKPDVDPKLVPIADNGGLTRTEALIAGSPALGDPSNSVNCPAVDERDELRPNGKCDIGAFEAGLFGPPTASTGDPTNVTDTSVKLAATINLDGEAGGFHFLYGTAPDALTSPTPEAAAGVPNGDTPGTETLENLTPDTTYYYLAVADNATASTTAAQVEQFTTHPGPPVIESVSFDSITDTTAEIHFSINPQGADTHYFVKYGPDSGYGQQTPTQDAGSEPGFQDYTVDLTGLDPNSTIHFDVVAENSIDEDVESDDNSFNTLQQVTGVAGLPVTVTDSGDTFFCPTSDDTTVDWGDGSPDTGAQIQCSDDGEDGTDYQLSDSHIYASPGDYRIAITYSDLGTETNVIADISANPDGLTNTAPPMISGTAQDGETLTTDNGGWDGNPEAYDYQWLDCDANGNNCEETGDDANSYTLTDDDVGQTIRVIVAASNDGGPAESESDATAVVTAPDSPPTDNTPPVVTGVAQQGKTLSTTNGDWDGNPTFAYHWQDCNAKGQSCANTGTDATTYALTAIDVGQTVRVIVTATNGAGSTQATSNLTATVAAPPSSPPPSSPPPPSPRTTSPSPPSVGGATAPTVSITSAGFSGSVTPNGLLTQAYFEYGLDPKYSGGGPVVYAQRTPAQSVGSDFSTHGVGPVAVAGLLPSALYHVRLVATNSDGATLGPDVTFTTEAAPAPGAPAVGKTVNVTPVSGFVLIKINGKFVPLTGLEQIPSGSQIDARHGSLELITSTGQQGKTQHGTFGGAIFRLTQERSGPSKGLATLTLLEGAFRGAPSYAICKKHKAGDASAAAASSKVLQLLHASAHGKFRTSGRYSAATVRGTIWTVADRCDGTLTHDVTDSVAVKDFVHHKTIILHAGQSYLAKKP